MSKQTINIGASPNDGTGTPLRTSFDYTNQNFTELYTALGGGVGLPGATTQVIFNDGGTNLAGDAGLVYNKTTDALTVAGLVTAGSATITGAATVGTTLGVTGNLSAAANSILGTGSKATDTLLDFSADTGSQRIYLDRGGRNLIFKDVTTNIENYRITGVTGVQTWGVGGTTAMTLNSTGLGIGGVPSGVNRFSVFNGATQALTLDTSGNLLVGTTVVSGTINGAGAITAKGLAGITMQTVTALATDYALPIGSFAGLIVIRSNGGGGSAVFMLDPNAGAVSISNNIVGRTITLTYSGGAWQFQQTVGAVTSTYNYLVLATQ